MAENHTIKKLSVNVWDKVLYRALYTDYGTSQFLEGVYTADDPEFSVDHGFLSYSQHPIRIVDLCECKDESQTARYLVEDDMGQDWGLYETKEEALESIKNLGGVYHGN